MISHSKWQTGFIRGGVFFHDLIGPGSTVEEQPGDESAARSSRVSAFSMFKSLALVILQEKHMEKPHRFSTSGGVGTMDFLSHLMAKKITAVIGLD